MGKKEKKKEADKRHSDERKEADPIIS